MCPHWLGRMEAWLAVANIFQGREESQLLIRDTKTRDETVKDKSLTFAHSYLIRGKHPPKPGHGCQAAVLKANH